MPIESSSTRTLGGKPVVRGTLYIAYPRFMPDDVKDCLAYTAALVADEAAFRVVTERGIRVRQAEAYLTESDEVREK